MEKIKVGDLVIITDWDINIDRSHYKGEISVVDRIEEEYYYLKNDEITKFTKEQISLIGYIKNNKHMIKCKKCGSTNVKVDFSQVYTSMPAMYGYQCNECGEHGYVNCDEAHIDNDDSNLDNEKINTPKDEIKGGLTGWICPKCGRCYSPFTSMCSYCSDNMFTITCNEFRYNR